MSIVLPPQFGGRGPQRGVCFLRVNQTRKPIRHQSSLHPLHNRTHCHVAILDRLKFLRPIVFPASP
jgi:hypothetical protein